MSNFDKPPSHQIKQAHLLQVGDSFTIPNKKSPNPLFEVISIKETNDWKIQVVVKINSIAPLLQKIGKEILPKRVTQTLFRDETIETGTTITFNIVRDETVIVLNPTSNLELLDRLQGVCSRGICQKGKIFMEYTMEEKNPKWMKLILYYIRLTLLENHLVLTEVTSEPGKIKGLLNMLPEHPLFISDKKEPYTPLMGVMQISSNLDIEEQSAIHELLLCYIKKESTYDIQEIDGQLKIELVIKGKTISECVKNKNQLKKQLKACYIDHDLDEDSELPNIKGFLSRSEKLQEKFNNESEGRIIT